MPSSLGESLDDKPKINMNSDISLEATLGSSKQGLLPIENSTNNGWQKQQCDSIVQNLKKEMSSTVSKGKTFCSSISLPEDRIFSSDCMGLRQDPTDSHSVIGLSRRCLSRTVREDEICSFSGDVKDGGLYDGFSETQTESQIVGYEEDLFGRQMLIDRARTLSSMA
ncbi:uncharacterized protein LOC111315665 [Durio zibethinus]|uniref:Uncharacterized protein LOC111315665 n=1 Tax=Durio zibethinus TaxID=66656 RepID=A0A6P6B7Z6_DURZI|nr:uncharacterized protein LOC111315665 [Durio zibethinus]